MEYTEVCVITDQKHKDNAAAIVQMVSNGIYIEDYEDIEEAVMEISHVDLIDESLLNKDRNRVVIHAYLNETEAYEKIEFIKAKLEMPHVVEITKISDCDWANNWKKYYKPFAVGDSLIVKPEWETLAETGGRKVLNIEPGLAFGTGMHETTKMCLLLLEAVETAGKSVLDVGCGSGILSIAALLFGARSATLIDIDPLAVKIAKQNASLNGFTIKAMEGDLAGSLSRDDKFDIVLANIIADAIIKMSPTITRHMNKEGVLICSGIIDDRVLDVERALKSGGLRVLKICEEKGWAAILAKH